MLWGFRSTRRSNHTSKYSRCDGLRYHPRLAWRITGDHPALILQTSQQFQNVMKLSF
jgi:hypothetical protein